MIRLMFASLLVSIATVAQAQPAAPIHARPQALADFSRFSEELNKKIALVDIDGAVREGVLIAAEANGVTIKFPSDTRFFASDQIASAEKMTDGRDDGVAKGVLWGLLLACMGTQGLTESDNLFLYFAESLAIFGAVGYALDAGESHRQLFYRAPAPAQRPAAAKRKLGLSYSFRF